MWTAFGVVVGGDGRWGFSLVVLVLVLVCGPVRGCSMDKGVFRKYVYVDINK